MIENCKAVQAEYELDDKTMDMVIASTPDGWNELDKLNYMDYAASQIAGFKENMLKHMKTDEYKKAFNKKLKQIHANNNGGSTDYYKFNKDWVDLQDVIEERNLNFAQGNILKAAWCLGSNRHAGTNYVRELNKIMWFCQRELDRVKTGESDEDEQEKFFKSYGRK